MWTTESARAHTPGAQSSGVLGVKGRNVLSEAIRERIVKLDTDEVLDSLRSGGLLRNFHQIPAAPSEH